MSRNSQKLNQDPSPSADDPMQQKQNHKDQLASLLGLSFVTPTEEVELPTEGRFYPSSSPLSGRKTLEIKSMTAREEDLLSSLGDGENDNVFNKLIQGLLVDQTINAIDIHEEDKLALLLRARATGYGDNYDAAAYCDKCEKTTDFTFSLRKTSVLSPKREVDYDPDLDAYSIELPISKINVKLKKLNDKDRESLEKEKQKKKSLNIDFNMTVSKIGRMIISANDVKEKATLTQLASALPAADAKTILTFHSEINPKLSTKQEVSCHVCGHTQEREVPLSWAFFRTDI